MRYLFLLIDLFNIPVAIIFSYRIKNFSPRLWKGMLIPVLVCGTMSALINSYFTYIGVWDITKNYTTGLMIGNMPFEEVLFCFSIPLPLALTFSYLTEKLKNPIRKWKGVDVALIFCLVNTAIYFNHKVFGFFVFALLCSLLVIARFVCQIPWLTKYYLTCIYTFFPLLVINNLLMVNIAGKPIMIYNSTQMIGTKIYSVPVEMVFYDMALILLNLLIYHQQSRRAVYYAHK